MARVTSPHYSELTNAIKRERYAQNIKIIDLAARIRMNPCTLYKRLREPWKFTAEEICNVCRVLGLDAVELWGKVMKGAQ